jgi:hypothetical protein
VIDRDMSRVQPEEAARAVDQGHAERLPEGVEGLLQVIASRPGIALGPEVGEELIPADAGWIVPGEERQQGANAAPQAGRRERLIVALNAETAKGPEAEHKTACLTEFDQELTGY